MSIAVRLTYLRPLLTLTVSPTQHIRMNMAQDEITTPSNLEPPPPFKVHCNYHALTRVTGSLSQRL